MGALKAWSYSSLNDFLNCPRSYQLKRVTKECKEEESVAMKNGNIVHKHLEDRVNVYTPLPTELEWMEPHISTLERAGGEIIAERRVTLNDKFEITTWFAKDAWLRAKLDLTLRFSYPPASLVFDYKTGKRKVDGDQLMLFAGLEFILYPATQEVRTGYIWLKDKVIDKQIFVPKDKPRIWGHFLPKVERLAQAHEKDVWPCKPSGLCPWCPARKAQCEYSDK